MPDGDRLRSLHQKFFSIDQGAIGIRTIKILIEDFVESAHIAILHRDDVIVVERLQHIEVNGFGYDRHGLLHCYPYLTPSCRNIPCAASRPSNTAVTTRSEPRTMSPPA